jgi:hypothetical protein
VKKSLNYLSIPLRFITVREVGVIINLVIKLISTCIIVILFLLTGNNSLAQKTDSILLNDIFIQPELLFGKIVPTRKPFPYSAGVTTGMVSVGIINNNREKYWNNYYNYPTAGVSFSYTNLGNEIVFGDAFSIAPFIQFKWSKHKINTSYFKFGIGTSYFMKYYNKATDSTNLMIGSHFTWNFQIAGYRYIYNGSSINIKVGIAYIHNSNGHIQLPNNGLNTANISLAAEVFTRKSDIRNCYPGDSLCMDRSNHYFFQVRDGNGVQEFGGRNGPAGSTKKGVYTAAMSGGIIFNQQIKVHAGLAYRYYEHYYEYIMQLPDTSSFRKNPRWSASNVFVFLGCEFLIGHFSIAVDEGINLYKPFYPTFFKLFESGPEVDFLLKKWIPSRMGLNYYLINTKYKPKDNIFIGAFINANFGQADFSEISIGYSHTFK